MVCVNCEIYRSTYAFCTQCGAATEHYECLECRFPYLDPAHLFCPECGTRTDWKHFVEDQCQKSAKK